MMTLDKGIFFNIHGLHGMLYGGPYRKFEVGTRRLLGLKMAAEINHPHDISVPTEDFSVPHPEDVSRGIIKVIEGFANGKDTYVGCMGGVGRTGLFMGCMVKCLNDYYEAHDLPGVGDPVAYVRAKYIPHAIETQEQQAFVRGFDSERVVWDLNRRFDYAHVVPTPVQVAPEVDSWECVRRLLNKVWPIF